MLTLLVRPRTIGAKKTIALRRQGFLPAILYGPGLKNRTLSVNLKEFQEVYQKAGESSVIRLKYEGERTKRSLEGRVRESIEKGKEEEYLVLIKEIDQDPVTGRPIHVDLFRPNPSQETQAIVPLIFEGEAPAVKELGGVLLKNIDEVEVRALPRNLPREIKVNISSLKTFHDSILIEDLFLTPGVRVFRDRKDVVVQVLAPSSIKEEAKPGILGEAEQKKEQAPGTKSSPE